MFFESASEASREVDRIREALDMLDEDATRVRVSSLEPWTQSGRLHGIEGRVAALSDKHEELSRRLETDYAIIDRACAVLYGTDNDAGLYRLVGWRADALYYKYIDGMTWPEIGAILGYSKGYVASQAKVALEVCDANGMVRTIAGVGFADE